MCGIMGVVGVDEAWPVVMAGLKRLEYRGYDSAGIATIHRKKLRVAREVGPLSALERSWPEGLAGGVGIGHTRWATHGGVTEANSHPHLDPSGEIAVVHNGIIDNADDLRAQIEAAGGRLSSETDSEILAHLIVRQREQGAPSLLDAVRQALRAIRGTAGLLVLCRSEPDRLIAARVGSPVIVGIGEGRCWVASDQLALAPFTDRIVVLDEGEVAEVSGGGLRTVDLDNRDRAKRVEAIEASAESAALGDCAHYMIKEILEQPVVIERALRGRLDEAGASARLSGIDGLGRRLFGLRQAALFGCGTSLHSAGVGQYLLERYARMPTRAADAAELVCRNPIVTEDTLHVAISQSGETADTILALREINGRGGLTAGLTNAVGSTIARETACGIHLHAGPEISVCSTKAFSAQVAALSLLALRFARVHHMPSSEGRAWVSALAALPEKIQAMLEHQGMVQALAERFCQSPYVMFVGRGVSVSVACEGALKLKEVAYTPADGLSGAGMKHGPLALIAPGTPVWALVPEDECRERMIGNLQELKSRGAHLIVVARPEDRAVARLADALVPLPDHHPALSPALTVVPLQFFAYHVALSLGREIDRPRNLAKAVTVT